MKQCFVNETLKRNAIIVVRNRAYQVTDICNRKIEVGNGEIKHTVNVQTRNSRNEIVVFDLAELQRVKAIVII